MTQFPNVSDHPTTRRFIAMGYAALVMIFLVFVAGSVVRATGAGMGCPDWPKCFGQWIPPTQESQLPAGYQTRYQVQGRLIEPFNATKTWTEYINRLVGAVAGLFVVGCVVFAFGVWRLGLPLPFLLSALSLVLMGVQGWLGAKVVDSFLAPYMISLHTGLALVIVYILLLAVLMPSTRPVISHNKARYVLGLALTMLVLTLTQVLIGTQVRESIDTIAEANAYTARESWVDALGISFYIHRSFSLILLVVAGVLYRDIKRYAPALVWAANGMLLLLAIEVAAGILLAYFAMPVFAQPIHLVVGSLLAAVTGYLAVQSARAAFGFLAPKILTHSDLQSPPFRSVHHA